MIVIGVNKELAVSSLGLLVGDGGQQEKYQGGREQNQVLENIAKGGQREAASRQNRYGDVDTHQGRNPERPDASILERNSPHNAIVGSGPTEAELLR